MNTVKLLREAAYDLEHNIPEQGKFRMSDWGTHPAGHQPEEGNYCGTTACAAGWLSLMPKWRKRGFISFWRLTQDESFTLCSGSPLTGKDWLVQLKDTFGREAGLELNTIFNTTWLDLDEVIEKILDLANDCERDSLNAKDNC